MGANPTIATLKKERIMALAMFNPCQPCCGKDEKQLCWPTICPGIQQPTNLYARFVRTTLSVYSNNYYPLGSIWKLALSDPTWYSVLPQLGINCNFSPCWNNGQGLLNFQPAQDNYSAYYPTTLVGSGPTGQRVCSTFYWLSSFDFIYKWYGVVSDAIWNKSTLPDTVYVTFTDNPGFPSCLGGQTWPLNWDDSKQMWTGQGICGNTATYVNFQRVDTNLYRLDLYGGCYGNNGGPVSVTTTYSSITPLYWSSGMVNCTCNNIIASLYLTVTQ